ncbi:hypothetical protein ASZ90_014999 [hydrocarbon metagenome]|uniref:Uncharacterized protein n=1 Tax=hydrocarbon metagenome TaxID=938273 RepID=A0A0W8F3G2_9ZZZZ
MSRPLKSDADAGTRMPRRSAKQITDAVMVNFKLMVKSP